MTYTFLARTKLPQERVIYRPYQRGNGDFFDKLSLTKAQKQEMRQQIGQLAVSHQIDTKTTNIPAGERVKSLLVLQAQLLTEDYNPQLLAELDMRMGMYLIFVLTKPNGAEELLIHYKEALPQTKEGKHYKIVRRFQTSQNLEIHLEGATLDQVYDNLIKEVADDQLAVKAGTASQAIDLTKQIQKLEKQAAQAKKKMYTEKSMSKQMEWRKTYQDLQAKIAALNS